MASQNEAEKAIPSGATAGTVQFRRIEISQPDLNPIGRICALTDAKPVPVADIANGPGKGLTRVGGQSTLAGIGTGDRGDGEDRKNEPPLHMLRVSRSGLLGKRGREERKGSRECSDWELAGDRHAPAT